MPKACTCHTDKEREPLLSGEIICFRRSVEISSPADCICRGTEYYVADPDEKLWGKPGELYHVSDVKGREFTAQGHIQPQCVNCLHIVHWLWGSWRAACRS